MSENLYSRMRGNTLSSLSARRYANGGIVDMPLNPTGSALDLPDTGSPGPIHSNNLHMLTLDPRTIQNEIQRGPTDNSPIYINPDAAKLGPYSPVGPPSLQAQPTPSSPLRSRLLGGPTTPSYQFDARQMAPPVDTSQQSSVFDQLGEGPSPTYKPLTPVGGAVYGLGLGLMGDPEAGLAPTNVATQTGLGAMQALAPPRKGGPVQEGIIISGRPEAPNAMSDLATSTGAQLGSGMWATGEAAAARTRQVKDWLTNAREQNLTAEEQDKLNAARQTSPELHQYADMLTPLEARKVISSPENVESFSRLMQTLPQDYQMAAAAKMGIPKLGWYYGSAHAIHEIFGSDAPRFAQMLAATSPKTSVESNLINALNIWKNWTAEGRPTDASAIKNIMARSVQGGTEKSALHAWVPNTIAALSAEDPMSVTLSGPKVDSFHHDLRNDVFKLAQDAWMANSYGIAQDAFQGSGANVLAGNPGMTPTYAAANARLRAGASQVGMLPTQGQETAWSTAMQLYELARKKNMDPRDVLQKGLLTPSIVAGAPDFSRLLKEPKYSNVLEQAGYGPQVNAMQPAPPVRIASTPRQLANQTGRIMPSSGVPLNAGEQQAMMEMAGILGETRGMRQRITRAKLFPGMDESQPTGSGNLQMEWYPGANTGIYPEIQPPNARLPWSTASNITSRFMTPFENQRGQNALLASSGLKSIPAENAFGAFTPPSGLAEINPARSYGFEAPLVHTPEGKLAVDPQTMANARAAGSLQSLLLGQQATGVPVVVRDPAGEDFSMRLPEKPEQPTTTREEVQALQQAYPNKAIIHTGPRLHVLNIGDVPMDDAARENMLSMMRATEGERATNIGDYMDDADAWAKSPGSGEATRRTMERYSQATPEAQTAMDQDVRYSARKLLEGYRQKARTQGWTIGRPDWENMLDTAAKQGIPGLLQGVKNGAFFPALAGAVLLPRLLRREDSNNQSGASTPR